MSEYPDSPGNPDSPDGTYQTIQLDIAVWMEPVPGTGEAGEWELMNYCITSLEDGQNRLKAKRRVHPESDPKCFRLVSVSQRTTISDLGD